jgi:hypothetical protein
MIFLTSKSPNHGNLNPLKFKNIYIECIVNIPEESKAQQQNLKYSIEKKNDTILIPDVFSRLNNKLAPRVKGILISLLFHT